MKTYILTIILILIFGCGVNQSAKNKEARKNANMNIIDLTELLKKEGVPDGIYNFSGKHSNEGFYINFNGQKWETYYLERGIKTELKLFEKEEEACEHLLPKILNYAGKFIKSETQ